MNVYAKLAENSFVRYVISIKNVKENLGSAPAPAPDKVRPGKYYHRQNFIAKF